MAGSFHPVRYDKQTRERAKRDKKALFCVEINRQYCEHLPDNERGVMTMWGPATDERAAEISRLLLKQSNISQEEIDKLYPPQPQPDQKDV